MMIEEFIEARIAEEEQIAGATVQWSLSWQDFTMDGELRDDENAGTIAMGLAPEDRSHMARHDPARVLRQCEALRLIVAEYRAEVDRGPAGTREDFQARHGGIVDAYLVSLRAIAAIWSRHPDFREEWKL